MRLRLDSELEVSIEKVSFGIQRLNVCCDIQCDCDDSCPSAVLDKLAVDQELDPKLKDHALTGELASFRECHLRLDLLLFHAKAEDPPSLILMRIGSQSKLI